MLNNRVAAVYEREGFIEIASAKAPGETGPTTTVWRRRSLQ